MSGRFVAGLIVGAMIMGPYRITADEKKIDPCGLVTKAEVEQVMGTLKEDPKVGTGLNPGEVTCDFTNDKGSWSKIRVYRMSSDSWEFQKNMLPNPPTKLSGIGDEALSTKRGTTTEVYVRKGETVLEVDSSGGIDFAKPIAEKAFTRLK